MRKSGYKNKAVFLLLAVLLFIAGLSILPACAEQEENRMIKEFEAKEKASAAVMEEDLSITRPTVEYKADDLRDPFQEPGVGRYGQEEQSSMPLTIAPPPLQVQGVIWGGSFNQAIINNKVVKAGDNVDGARIVSIDKNGIIIIFEGKQFTLSSPAAGQSPKKAEGGK